MGGACKGAELVKLSRVLLLRAHTTLEPNVPGRAADVDALRADWGGVHNQPNPITPLVTPNFDRLAREGVRFTHAHVASPVCAPSRACLAAGREYDEAGQPSNTWSMRTPDNDFDVTIPTFYDALRSAGVHTAVAGRDDLTKRSGPGLDGSYHAHELGFSAQRRCAGSVDVTWGECAGVDGGAAPCAGRFANESSKIPTVHDPYGRWLAAQPLVSPRYNATNGFELDFARYSELLGRGPYNSASWYAIPDAMPFPDAGDGRSMWQDDWIGRQALELLAAAPEPSLRRLQDRKSVLVYSH